MYKALSILVLVVISVGNTAHAFNKPSPNLERFSSFGQGKNVGIDLCPACIDEAVQAINVILNIILDEGIVEDCGKLCEIAANKTGSSLIGTICDLACDAVGIDEFIRLIVEADIDPIWYCEIARLCPSNQKNVFFYL